MNGHRFGAHWGTTVTGHSAVIRRYVDDRVTVIMLANVDGGGLGIDAMSRPVAAGYQRHFGKPPDLTALLIQLAGLLGPPDARHADPPDQAVG